ncbi:MAG: alpha/beta fold hydrolase [Polyangiales bacterium]
MKRALAGVLLSLASCANLDAFLFNPTPVDRYELAYDADAPASWRVPDALREEVEVTSRDGTRVYGYYLRRPDPEAATAPVVFYSHGNTRNLDLYWTRAGHLWALGANVLIYDYRGYGRTRGTPSEQAIYDDANAMLAWLRTGPRAAPAERLYLYGYSLGAAITCELASTTTPFRAMILEAPFASVAALVEDGTLVVPRSLLTANRFNNRAKVARATQNAALGTTIFHGLDDDFVQPSNARRLDAAIGEAGPHTLVLLEGADHDTISRAPPNAVYEARMRALLGR